MLFPSFIFILLFLPITFAVWYAAARISGVRTSIFVLVLASIFFYGWWNPAYLLLLGASIAGNYVLARVISDNFHPRNLTIVGIAANLGVLGYFKYAEFFVSSSRQFVGFEWEIGSIVLPLAISFFTFQQIAYLIDVFKGNPPQRDLIRYAFFVGFFPQLIAGPIVHHREIFPQLVRGKIASFPWQQFSIGLTIFALGLGKKVLIADSLSGQADRMFDSALLGFTPNFLDAWFGALSYAFQIYFDFSGYADMATGLAFMFGIRLPLNFDSPYKSSSLIEFWRRWHITLSRFLRNYLYIPLGGNRKGPGRRLANLMIVMLLGGLWHGAGWTFIAWGGMHGAGLIMNQMWRLTRLNLRTDWPGFERVSWLLTFLFVVVAWVFFRAEDFGSASRILAGMLGFNGIVIPYDWPSSFAVGTIDQGQLSVYGEKGLIVIFVAAIASFALPNVQSMMGVYSPTLQKAEEYCGPLRGFLLWRPSIKWVFGAGSIFIASLVFLFIRVKSFEFIYFQF